MSDRTLRGCFVTGTDTGAGKTVLAAAITAALRTRDIDVVPLKPVVTGLDEAAPSEWPHDHELLARAGGVDANAVSFERYGPPASPHLAGELAGRPINFRRLLGRIRAVARRHELAVIEGVGGLMVPLAPGCDVRELVRSLGLPLLIAARPGLGTINHTLLTLAAARAARLNVQAVVMTPWPRAAGTIERSNRATIAALGAVAVEVLPAVERGEPELLAQAAESLPVDQWLAGWLGRSVLPTAAGNSF